MLQLLLEIPNPGGRGRRLVASAAGCAPAAHVHTRARTGSEGPDFLAVEWPTVQRLESQAVRDDADRVMLIGIDASRLSTGDRDRIRDALRELRPEIARILASIDWNTSGHETVIESAALADMLRGPAFSHLPMHAELSSSRETRTTAPPRPSTGNTPRLLALAVSAIVLLATLTWWRGTSIPPPPPPPKPDVALKDAANAMKCSEQDLRSWINSAQGKPADAPIDALTLRILREHDGVARFFALDQTPAEPSQLREFVELLNPRTADECKAVRVGLSKAHTFLFPLQASAAAAGRCNDWLPRLEAKQRFSDAMEPRHVRFVASLVSIGGKLSGSGKTAQGHESPFFCEDDHRAFIDLAGLFTPERRAPLSAAIGRDLYTSDRQANALQEVVEKMPLTAEEARQLAAIGETANSRTGCLEFKPLVEHFIELCNALSDLSPAGKAP